MIIQVKVSGQKLFAPQNVNFFAPKSKKFVQFQFDLGDDWNGLTVCAQFQQNGNTYNSYLDRTNCAYLPTELKSGKFTLMLLGTSDGVTATSHALTLTMTANEFVQNAQSTDLSKSLYDQLVDKVNTLAGLDEEQIQTIVENTSKEVIDQYLKSGVLAALTIEKGTVSRDRVDANFEATLKKADGAMQASVYDKNRMNRDVFEYTDTQMLSLSNQLKSDIDEVEQHTINHINDVKNEIADAYKIGDSQFDNLGDAVRGALDLSKVYAQNYLSQTLDKFKGFTTIIVSEEEMTRLLHGVGALRTFYLVEKESGYEKYWYVYDENTGKYIWDNFGSSSTVVINSLDSVANPSGDIDYIVQNGNGYVYYKWIDEEWKVIAGSSAEYIEENDDDGNPIDASLPESGDSLTDYYLRKANGRYLHYRWIHGEFTPIGSDAYSKDELDAILNDQYYTKADLDIATQSMQNSIDMLVNAVDANTTNAAALDRKITAIQDQLAGMSDGHTYDFAKVEDPDGGYSLCIWQDSTSESGEDPTWVIKMPAGGGDGETSSASVMFERVTPQSSVITADDKYIVKAKIAVTDSDGDTVDATYTWTKNGTTIASGNVVHYVDGNDDTIMSWDLTEFVTIGANALRLVVVDATGQRTPKSYSVQKVDLGIDSTFSDRYVRDAGTPVNFTYTLSGAISKTVHFKLDGEEFATVTTSSSGTLMSQTIPAQSHGSHLLDVYVTANINGIDVTPAHIYKDIVWYDSKAESPVIGCTYRADHYGVVDVRQYDTLAINYSVFDPTTATPTVSFYVDDVLQSTNKLTATSDVWNYRANDVMDENHQTAAHQLKIVCRDTTVVIDLLVTKLGIDVEPVAGAAFDFNPNGYSNNSSTRLWTDGVHRMTVSDNFDWNNGGYQTDDEGNRYFCVKAGTTARFDYKLFADQNASRNGKEFKIVFRTSNVCAADASFLNALTTDGGNVGLEMAVHNAYLWCAGTSPLNTPYCEENRIEYEFNVNPIDTEDPAAESYAISWEDGTPSKPIGYDNNSYWYPQSTDGASDIIIGSPSCDVWIYRMKAYENALTDSDITRNFIADSVDSKTMLERYDRNAIYKTESGEMVPYSALGTIDFESLAEARKDLRIICISAPKFTNKKSDFVKNTTVRCIYKGGDSVLDNWTYTNAYHSGQGTTSDNYGDAGRNIDILGCFDGIHQATSKIPLDTTYITELTLGDGTVLRGADAKVSLSRTSIPNNWFNIKLNIASSENANNALLQKRYDRYLPYITVAKQNDPRCKNSMEFFNCVVFVKETDPDLSTHREFNDNNWHFYGIGNIGDSKKTDSTRANDVNDPHEFCVEISDNILPNSQFNTGVYNDDGTIKFPVSRDEWKPGNERYDSLWQKWDDSFEFRYDLGGDTKDGNSLSSSPEADAIREQNRNIWRYFYEFVILSSDEEFRNGLSDWFIEESAFYWDLFTLRYEMIDSRAKNTFWHYGKVIDTMIREVKYPQNRMLFLYLEKNGDEYIPTQDTSVVSGKKYYIGHAFEMWDYDNDTAIGIDNDGAPTIPYGTETLDQSMVYNDETGTYEKAYYFNAAESVFWQRIEDNFKPELRRMFQTCDTAGCFSASSLINEMREWQMQFPEVLWIEDCNRKYVRTYRGAGFYPGESTYMGGKAIHSDSDYLLNKFTGKRMYQREEYEYANEAYFASWFMSTTASNNAITFRCKQPAGVVVPPDYTIEVVPYTDMYVTAAFGNSGGDSAAVQVRAKAGQSVQIVSPWTEMTDTQVSIYCGSRIQALGSLASCYLSVFSMANGQRLQRVEIGSGVPGYQNSYLNALTFGNTPVLKYLDIRGCMGFTSTLNLAGCLGLETLLAQNTAVTGVTFATNGLIKEAHLPDTVTNLTMRYLNDLHEIDANMANMITLDIRGGQLDVFKIITDIIGAGKIRNLTLYDIDWEVGNTNLLNAMINLFYSYVAGKVYISGQVRRRELERYAELWPDLDVQYSPSNIVVQYPITFCDYDGTVLNTQYVDAGSDGYDPVEAGEIPTPTRASDDQYIYTFDGWDKELTGISEAKTCYAKYATTTRTYTVTWFTTRGDAITSLDNVPYGAEVIYRYPGCGLLDPSGKAIVKDGLLPVHPSNGVGTRYYVFKGWDRSTGYIRGDTNVIAVWESALVPSTNKALNNMNIAEIYGVTKYCLDNNKTVWDEPSDPNAAGYWSMKDYTDITLGNDVTFNEISSDEFGYVNSTLLVGDGGRYGDQLVCDGNHVYDTGIKLFDADSPSFVLAVDYKYSGTTANRSLVSCYSDLSGVQGFRILYNTNPMVEFGGKTTAIGSATAREMCVIRHIKGENRLFIYTFNGTAADYTNLSVISTSTAPYYNEMTSIGNNVTDATLCFGGVRYSDGGTDYLAAGTINWCKVWFDDLGDNVSRLLAVWPHEILREEFFGAQRYRISNGGSQKCSASFIGNNLLSRGKTMNPTNTNVGGWNASDFRKFCLNKLYYALPTDWRSIIKPVNILSNDGNSKGASATISTTSDFVYIPAFVEIASNGTGAPYGSEGVYMTGTWFGVDNSVASNQQRVKWRGRIRHDDDYPGFRLWTSSEDPALTSVNNVKEGDIWKKGQNDAAQMYCNGAWVGSNSWWVRSAYASNSTYFYNVSSGGYANNNNHNATGTNGVCLCFSV